MLWKVRALYSDGPSLMRAVILSPFLSVAGKLCGSVLTGAGRGGGGWGLPLSVHRPAHVGTAQTQGVSDRPSGEVEPAHPGVITRCKRSRVVA